MMYNTLSEHQNFVGVGQRSVVSPDLQPAESFIYYTEIALDFPMT